MPILCQQFYSFEYSFNDDKCIYCMGLLKKNKSFFVFTV